MSIDTAYVTSYQPIIGTMVLSYTVFELFGVQNIIPPVLITVSRNNRLSYLDSMVVASLVA